MTQRTATMSSVLSAAAAAAVKRCSLSVLGTSLQPVFYLFCQLLVSSLISPYNSPINLRISPKAEVNLVVPTTQRAERVAGAVAHPCAAQRRFTLMGVNIFLYVHTSFPFDPEVMQAGSTRNFT